MTRGEGVRSDEERAAEERRGPAGVRRGGPPHMQMGVPGEKASTFGPSARRLLNRLAPYRTQVAVIVLLSVASVVLGAVGPRLLGHATDLIFSGFISARLPAGTTKEAALQGLRDSGQGRVADVLGSMTLTPGVGIDMTALGRVLLLALGLYLVSAALQWLSGYLLAGVIQSTVSRLRTDVAAKLNRLPLPYVDGQPRGELLSRVTNDVDNVGTSLQQTLGQLLVSLLTVIAVIGMMFSLSWLLTLIALVTIPLSMALTGAVAKRSQGLFVRQWKHTGELNGLIEETFTGHGLVKLYGRQREADEAFRVKNDELYRAAYGAQFISGTIMPAMMFLGNLNYVAIAVVGGLRVASGQLSVGDVQAFIQYSRQFTQPLTQVASMANLLQSGVASAERVFQVLDAPEQVPDAAAPLPRDTTADQRGEIRFEDVSFSYDPARPLIQHLNLTVQPGQTVAIVGPTGAGKTTLVNLILRFYELSGGRITLGGVDITQLPRHELRSRIGMVLQDTWLFAGTIRDNIAYGRPTASEAEILAAAQATYVDRFVHSLPAGYDTVLDDEAGNISAGEKQLITIARAFLANPDLLILDEATSSVDTRTELLVQQAMAALRSDRTSFVIAHRLSTIKGADLILVMQAGQIVEQGTHEELLARRGLYAGLYEAQFSGSGAETAPLAPMLART
ncbi:ABC transporter ATP-binding protein [uncultured Deinococcus sp.]|uniref:ABC transporter ATP-binding protein n=1 Tax=uncultured Deinococcus sp. TaxID=158789 RepID=UPI0025DD3A71|nr:ABC transporter ATP-binding protein [uncultured Deinococcus sp.]